MLKSIYSFNHGDCLNVSTRCTLVTTSPNFTYSFKFLECTTYRFLSNKFGVNFLCGADSGKTDCCVGEYIERSMTIDSCARV